MIETSSFLRRANHARQQWGTIGTLRRTTQRIWHHIAHNRHALFKHPGHPVAFQKPQGLSIARYNRLDEVPESLLSVWADEESDRILTHLRHEFADSGILYVGTVEGMPVTRMWLRYGRSIRHWFVDLEANDYVLYAMHTHPAHRGKGLIRALILQALDDERPCSGTAYVDCKVWNTPSIRAIGAMGFKRFATMPPLSKSPKAMQTVYLRKGRLRRLVYTSVSIACWGATLGGRLPQARGGVVLCYHGVADHEAEMFAKQMSVVAKRTIAPSALCECLRSGFLRSHVCVTFDDAYANLLTNALPVMRDLGITATIFVPTGNLGRCPKWKMQPGHAERTERIMTEAELLQAVRDGGVRIGSHTVTHARLNDLSPADLEQELRESKAYLEDLLGRPVEMLALPYGAGSPHIIDVAREVGYTQIFTLTRRIVSPTAAEGALGRFLVDPGMPSWEFRMTSDGAYRWLGQLSARSTKTRNVS